MNQNSDNSYPAKKIIATYVFVGGLLGFLPVLLFIILKQSNYFRVSHSKVSMLVLSIWTVGFCSALFMGMILAYFKVRIFKLSDYFRLFLMAFGVVFVCCIITIVIKTIGQFHDRVGLLLISDVLMCLVLSLIGGILSTILAIFTLPKS